MMATVCFLGYSSLSMAQPMAAKDSSEDKNNSSMPMNQNMPHQMGLSSTKTTLPVSDGSAPGNYDDYGVSLRIHDDPLMAKVQLEKLEAARTNHGEHFQDWDGRIWAGYNLNKLWLRTEGTITKGKTEEGNAELLWGHAISPFWDSMLGFSRDLASGPSRNWLALGVQGVAPYEFETEATLYLGPSGRTAFRFKTSQEWLFTQRLILTPELEMNFYGKNDPSHNLGSGLSDGAISLRLRYEVSRKFAPYVGVKSQRTFGKTASMAEAEGASVSQQSLVAGIKVWF
jgi:copper resistance protein B